jgi:hypothetical protein
MLKVTLENYSVIYAKNYADAMYKAAQINQRILTIES